MPGHRIHLILGLNTVNISQSRRILLLLFDRRGTLPDPVRRHCVRRGLIRIRGRRLPCRRDVRRHHKVIYRQFFKRLDHSLEVNYYEYTDCLTRLFSAPQHFEYVCDEALDSLIGGLGRRRVPFC